MSGTVIFNGGMLIVNKKIRWVFPPVIFYYSSTATSAGITNLTALGSISKSISVALRSSPSTQYLIGVALVILIFLHFLWCAVYSYQVAIEHPK